MQILQVYPYYPPAWEYGGALRVVYKTAKTLAAHGHDITVYTTDSAGAEGRITSPDIHDSEDVSVHYFPNLSNTLARKLHAPIPLGLYSTLDTSIDEFDIAHVHGFPHLLGWLTTVMARRHDVPYVLTPHSTINRPDDSTVSLKTAFSLAFGDSIISDACQIIALTEVEGQRLRDYGIPAEKIVRIPNGVSGDYRVPPTQAENFRSDYGYDDSWLVTFVGRLHPTKGLDLLMDTAEDLQDQTIDGKAVQLAIIGPDDGYRKHLDNRVDSLTNVDLLGYLPEDEKNAALTATDVYVHPSTYETKPQSALEACAAGTPVLISDESSFPEIDTHDAGRVLKRSPDAFSGRIVDLLKNDTERERMADSAIELIETEFTWDAVASRLETLYASCRDSN